MKAIVSLTIFFLLILKNSFCQVKIADMGLSSQYYSKEITEYISKQHIVTQILNVEEQKSVLVDIDAITAAQSGELTTVVYSCSAQDKKGILLAFWNPYLASSAVTVQNYAFKNLN